MPFMAPLEVKHACPPPPPFYELAVYDGEKPLGRLFVGYSPSNKEAVLVLAELLRQLEETYDSIAPRSLAGPGPAAELAAEQDEVARALKNVRELLDSAKARL